MIEDGTVLDPRPREITCLADAQQCIVPETGSFVGWKHARDGALVKLLIPAHSRQTSGPGRQCRCDFAEVLEVVGSEVPGFAVSVADPRHVYQKGRSVFSSGWVDRPNGGALQEFTSI
jgi:hypothetical protein